MFSDDEEEARMTDEYPDQAGYPDGTGTLSEDQKTLIDEVAGEPPASVADLYLVHNDEKSSYDGIVGDTQVGTISYAVKDDRLVVLSTKVWPEYRGQGIATELVRQVLDDIRSQGKKITVECPIVRSYIDRNPSYDDLVDPEHPGLSKGA
jgi:predicted GNAT family acetyltransferase